MIVRAPASLAPCTTFSPTPPRPITSTLGVSSCATGEVRGLILEALYNQHRNDLVNLDDEAASSASG